MIARWNRLFPEHEIKTGDWIVEANYSTEVDQMMEVIDLRFNVPVLIFTMSRPTEALHYELP